MKIALIGYGKMGHAVEAVAVARGHQVCLRLDTAEQTAEAELKQVDVAIEFTQPQAAVANIARCIEVGVPVVSGTTGWYVGDAYAHLAEECRQRGGRMLTATNFSVGMNIMFELNQRLARLMSGRDDYKADIVEIHHIHKLDAPSGTAISLQQQVEEWGGREAAAVPIASERVGEVPGTHTVSYRSAIDTISITHEAHNREGLAAGALLAAEWLATAQAGVYTMRDVLGWGDDK